MDVPAPDAYLGEILVQFFRHPLGKRGDEHALVAFGAGADLLHEVVDLVLDGPDLDGRVQQAGRPDDLFHHEPFGLAELVVGWSGAHIDLLACHCLELVECQRAVVGCRRKAESILHEHGLARMVAAVHRVDLRERHVALVYERDEVVREIVYQAERPLAGLAPVEISGIVLDAGAVAHLLDHLQVILHPLFQALGLEVLAYAFEIVELYLEVVLDMAHGRDAALLGGDEVVGRIDGDLVYLLYAGSGHGVDDGDAVHLVAEEFYADGIVSSAEIDVHRVPPHPEGTALELHFSA